MASGDESAQPKARVQVAFAGHLTIQAGDRPARLLRVRSVRDASSTAGEREFFATEIGNSASLNVFSTTI